MPAPITIRKSLAGQLNSIVAAVIGLTAILYAWVRLSFSFVRFPITIALAVFIFFTLKKILHRKIQIALSDEGIMLQEDHLIKWEEIKAVFLDTRRMNITLKGYHTYLTYLNIEPVFSGQFSGQQVVRSIVVSDMDMPPAIILHHIRAFLRWYRLSASLQP